MQVGDFEVTVDDKDDQVVLTVGTWTARLAPDKAERLARQLEEVEHNLIVAADRVEARRKIR